MDAYHTVVIIKPIMKQIKKKCHRMKTKTFMNCINARLTAKYGLQADKTTLCAFKNFPSAASVQSTSVPFSNNVSNTDISVL